METIFMKTKNSKTNGPQRFRLSLGDKFNPKEPSENLTLPNLSIHYIWKNIKSAYNNNEFKISAPAWDDEFICLMNHTLLQISKINLNLSSKNMKL